MTGLNAAVVGRSLPELDELITQMLEARGSAIDDPVAVEGDDLTRALEQSKDRCLYEYLIEERAAP